MPQLERPGVSLYYEDHRPSSPISDVPILLIAPGGMRSTVGFWENAPWNPVTHLADRYRVIAMDQRNAGGSRADVHGTDGWSAWTADQLALLDHLGVGEFAVLGMCIGGSYIANLLATAPPRIRAAVTLQPIGRDGNQERFDGMFDDWAAEIAGDHPEATDADWAALKANLFGGGGVLFSIPDEALARFTTPWLVLMGGDASHPESASRRVAELAPGATLVERWKAPEHVDAGKQAVDAFLAERL